MAVLSLFFLFFFNDTATTEIYTLSLHDALPISLVNGYSDYIPVDVLTNVMTLAPFPSRAAFKLLESGGVRYAVFHMYGYNTENRNDVLARLKEFAPYFRPLYVDDETQLDEIIGYPP